MPPAFVSPVRTTGLRAEEMVILQTPLRLDLTASNCWTLTAFATCYSDIHPMGSVPRATLTVVVRREDTDAVVATSATKFVYVLQTLSLDSAAAGFTAPLVAQVPKGVYVITGELSFQTRPPSSGSMDIRLDATAVIAVAS